MQRLFTLSRQVKAARQDGRPLVALESTLISHGLPKPANLETARAMEEAIRKEGAAPATIAVLDGRVRIGLSQAQLQRVADEPLTKASSRDLPQVVAAGGCAATTVAATLFLAHRAGIRIMATGGIGGVHRDVTESGDVSADLLELSRTPVAVVCSGAKSILDLRRTVECLESLAVPVVGYQTAEWPAFYSRKSGIPLEQQVTSPAAVARLLEASFELDLAGGVLVVHPVPESQALEAETAERLIQEALAEAGSRGIAGKEVTPFLLARIAERSGGRALQANRALLVANAVVAARIARQLRAM
ncbi:MAG: pseudouridine-5'-phosphate glycosidase [Acidobacteriota bacterium]